MSQSRTAWLLARSDAQLQRIHADAVATLTTRPLHPDARADKRSCETILRGRAARKDGQS